LGVFGSQQLISTAVDGPRSVLAVDIDADGDVDAVSTSLLDDRLAWYSNLILSCPGLSTDIQVACDSFTWRNGVTYTASNNTATDTLVGASFLGCDSIITLDLTIFSPSMGIDVQTACDSFTWRNGVTYRTSNNTAMDTIIGGAFTGCDSIVTLNLTIGFPTAGTDTQTACDSFTWIDGITYTSSNNTATFLTTNALGCDSTVTLDLTINNSTVTTDVRTACAFLLWVDGNIYTSSNNTATATTTSSTGCDSVIILDLTIENNTGTDIQTACNSYTWIDGNTYTTSTNSPTATLTNAAGCDSVVTLNLTINSADATVQTAGNSLIANATGASYQWLACNNGNAPIAGATSRTFNPTANGDYAVVVTENGCTDTSNCVSFMFTTVSKIRSKELAITFAPNPTTGLVAIDLGRLEAATVTIYAANGQLVQQVLLQGQGQHQLTLEGAAGVYFVKIQVGDQLQYNKLIKR
jgi:hypothetical protein